jgi:uncharacterized delta-60 repeat protein
VLTSAGDYDIFIARYNADGTLNWAKRAGSAAYTDLGAAISVFSDDSIAVTGYFYGYATFGPGEDNETVLSSAGGYDVFIARYNPDGTLHWARRAGGVGSDGGYGISVLSDDSIAVGGWFEFSAKFGKGEDNETVFSSAGNYDVFTARYNPDGTLNWAKRAGGTGWDSGRAVSVLSDDSIAATGYFTGTATFGPNEENETALSSAGSYDVFIARYNK